MPRTIRTKPREPVGTPVNDLLAKLLAIKRGEPDKVPKDHLTCVQWAEKWGVRRTVAQSLIQIAVQKKLMAMKKYRVESGVRLYPVAHYYEV
jgi:hypothetical protein